MTETDAFPLDISYNEISTWLANRRKLATDWIKRLREVQSRSAKAFATLPVGFAAQFESCEDGVVDYPTAKRIRDALAETAERGYFGGLSGEAATWDKIVKSYEKGNLYLGDAGQRILRNVDYEVPFLKKRMDTLDKRAMELTRQKSDCEHRAASSAAAFAKECEALGIGGANWTAEFSGIANRIYDLLRKGFDALATESIQTAVAFYRSMSQELHETGKASLPIVQQILEKRLEPPSPDRIKDIHASTPAPSSAKEMIGEASGETEVEINWDVAMETLEGDTGLTVEMAWEEDGGINWDIEMEPVAETSAPSTGPTTQPRGGEVDKDVKDDATHTAVPASVLCFVWDPSFRHALLDDLYELQSFLTVRSLSDASDAVSLTLSEVLRRYDPSETQQHLTHLRSLLDIFTSETTERYLMLKTSKSYADRLLSDLHKKSHREIEWVKLATQAEQERSTVQTELRQVALQLEHLSRQIQDLKLLVEQDISPLFHNRQINIMGKINAVIRQS